MSAQPLTLKQIDAPGRYPGIPNAFYHGHLTKVPALGSSGAVKLMQTCPATFWQESILNPDYEPEHKSAFDIGTAAHLAMLEPDLWNERVVVVPFDDYRTSAAKAARDDAYSKGKTPLKPQEARQIAAMRAALVAHPLAGNAFTQGVAESTYVWIDDDTGCWCKARPDYLRREPFMLIDFKSSGSANPREFARRAWDLGYFQQAAWYLEGVGRVEGEIPTEFWFVVQEVDPPHLVTVNKLPDRWIEYGAMMNAKARDTFAECLRTSRWPGYRPNGIDRDVAFTLEMPTWAEFEIERRKEFGEFSRAKRITAEQAAIADRFHRPLSWDQPEEVKS